jgi:hypothetical protein
MLKEFSMFGIILTSLLLVGGIQFDDDDVAYAQFFEDGSGTNTLNFHQVLHLLGNLALLKYYY